MTFKRVLRLIVNLRKLGSVSARDWDTVCLVLRRAAKESAQELAELESIDVIGEVLADLHPLAKLTRTTVDDDLIAAARALFNDAA